MITTVEVRFARRDMIELAKERMRAQGVDMDSLPDSPLTADFDDECHGYLVSFELEEPKDE
ncbi:MAG: hypothetical protein CMQ38_12885 [Gammaproteobacteria bacterium]|nr:hypothetical protein [Gammaproteobacteria bacterium]